MRTLLCAAFSAAVALSALAAPATMNVQLPSAAPGATDPFAWLEDIHSPKALAWVETQNARTAAVLETDPRYALFHRDALAIFTAKDRIPYPRFLGSGVDNFWQDQDHVKGLWRRATFASYNSPTPAWETLIDFDALSRAEGKNWIFKGATCLPPDDRLCLVRMSNGGGDAVEIREFDTRARAFVSGGFHFAVGKQTIEWLDPDTLLIARDFGPGTLTASGYPFVVKELKRGQPLADAKEVFRGTAHDVSADPVVLRGPDGAVEHVLYRRGVAFFSARFWLALPDGGTRPLDLPEKIEVHGYLDHRMILTLNEAWPAGPSRLGPQLLPHDSARLVWPGHPAFTAGDLIAFNPATGAAELIFHPSPTQTVNEAAVTQNRLLVELLDNVNGALDIWRHGPGGWRAQRLAFPKGL
ncbi:MAG TPA: S9 family peptidase, partial [Caulobacteraceae bacterium]